MKRRGFIQTILGGLAGLTVAKTAESEESPSKAEEFEGDPKIWLDKLGVKYDPEIAETTPGEPTPDVFAERYGRGSSIHMEAKRLYGEYKDSEIQVIPESLKIHKNDIEIKWGNMFYADGYWFATDLDGKSYMSKDTITWKRCVLPTQTRPEL